jgi:hypothetical protein
MWHIRRKHRDTAERKRVLQDYKERRGPVLEN